MLDIPVIRWGQPYESMEKKEVVHFESGETLATADAAATEAHRASPRTIVRSGMPLSIF